MVRQNQDEEVEIRPVLAVRNKNNRLCTGTSSQQKKKRKSLNEIVPRGPYPWLTLPLHKLNRHSPSLSLSIFCVSTFPASSTHPPGIAALSPMLFASAWVLAHCRAGLIGSPGQEPSGRKWAGRSRAPRSPPVTRQRTQLKE